MNITAAPFNLNWVEFNAGTNGVNTPGEGRSLHVYPNPSAGTFHLRAELSQAQDLELMVFNYAGQITHSQLLHQRAGIDTSIDLSDQPTGVYFLTLRLADGRRYTQKLIKTID